MLSARERALQEAMAFAHPFDGVRVKPLRFLEIAPVDPVVEDDAAEAEGTPLGKTAGASCGKSRES